MTSEGEGKIDDLQSCASNLSNYIQNELQLGILVTELQSSLNKESGESKYYKEK